MSSFISTRGGGDPLTFEDVLLAGLAPDGGLYVPERWPQLNMERLKSLSYPEVAASVMLPFVGDCIEENDFHDIIEATYNDQVFRHPDVVPLKQLYPNVYALELFHGPTIAFKDVALQLLGRLFDHVLKKRGQRVTIVGATSGDTGSAAIEGCRHSSQVDIFILHPKDRVSDVQRRQMTTVDAPNVNNIALEGTFDDCQNLVKAMFNDADFRKDMNLSAVNSINWARIMAQIVYYVTSALQLDALEKDVSFVVPTGNFGNVYAAYCARKMGLPIKTLALSTNRNDILTRFFETGEMKAENVEPTVSPSMDIQISSNFERFLFDLTGRDAETLVKLMNDFKESGSFSMNEKIVKLAGDEFKAFRASEDETLETIKRVYEDTEYILDPHTAVGMKGALELVENTNEIVVSLACAHPAKFPDAVETAIGVRPELPEHLGDLLEREEIVTALPNDIEQVKNFVRGHSKVKQGEAA